MLVHVPFQTLGVQVPVLFVGLQGQRLQTPPEVMQPQFQYFMVPQIVPWFWVSVRLQVGGFGLADWMHQPPTAAVELTLLDE